MDNPAHTAPSGVEKNAEFWGSLLLDFRTMMPSSKLMVKYEQEATKCNVEWTSLPGQEKMLQFVIQDPLCAKFPPSSVYIGKFLKFYLAAVEASRQPMNEDLMELYFGLDVRPKSEGEIREVCHKTYRLDNPPVEPLDVTVRMANQLDNVGLTSWEAGFFLAEWVTSNPQLFENKVCLELGAGIGLTGIVFQKKTQAAALILSDYTEPVLSNLSKNLSINDIPHATVLDPLAINQSKMQGIPKSGPISFVIEIDWEKIDESVLSMIDVDIVLVADCVYDIGLIDALVTVLGKILKPSNEGNRFPCCYIATTLRNPKTFEYFRKKVKEEGLTQVDVQGMKLDRMFDYEATIILSHIYRAASSDFVK